MAKDEINRSMREAEVEVAEAKESFATAERRYQEARQNLEQTRRDAARVLGQL
jgi:hypothetical protein